MLYLYAFCYGEKKLDLSFDESKLISKWPINQRDALTYIVRERARPLDLTWSVGK